VGESTPLEPRHRERLEQRSAIAPDVLAERGVRSVAAADPRLGPFADYQRADGILIPLYPPDGSNGRYTLRRDHDRLVTDRETGKQRRAKYEQPAGQAHRLDVHPRNRPALSDPTIPLWVTEGIFKNDALASAGRCSIGLGGVWCFQKECLPDWDLIALQGRTVLIAFDSDAETNPNVGQARDALAAFLTERGARVRIVRLPAGPNGEKVGIDDYLGNGGDLVDLVAAGAEDWRPPGQGDCARDDCRAVRRELTDQREIAVAEARIISAPKGQGIAPNRRLAYLLMGRRYFSDATRDRFTPERTPVVDPDGWDRIPLQTMAADVGLGYSALLAARKELVAGGQLEERKRDVVLDNGRRVEVTDVRPSRSAPSLKAWVAQLATVVQAPTGWGGARWRCPVHHDADVITQRVCARCGADAVRDDGAAIGFQVENRSGATDAPEETVSSAGPRTYSDDLENRSADVGFQVENRSGAPAPAATADRPMTTDEVRAGVADMIARRTDFQLENRSPAAAPAVYLLAHARRHEWAPLATRHGTIGGDEDRWRKFLTYPPPWLPEVVVAASAMNGATP